MGLKLKSLLFVAAVMLGSASFAAQEASAATRYYTKFGKRYKDVITERIVHVTRYRYKTVIDHCGRRKVIRVPYRVCKRLITCRTYCLETYYKRIRKCYTRRVRVVDDCGRVRYVLKTFHRWVRVPAGRRWVYVRTTYKTLYA